MYLTFSVPIMLIGVSARLPLRFGRSRHDHDRAAARRDHQLRPVVDCMPCVRLGGVALRRHRDRVVRCPGGGVMTAPIRASIHAAAPADVSAIFALMMELAEFKKLTHLFVATEDGVRDALFGPRPAAQSARRGRKRADHRLHAFLPQFLSFRQRGLYLENPLCAPEPAWQRLGTKMLTALAALAIKRQCGRFEWSCSTGSRRPSTSMRRWAPLLPDWRIVRITGESLDQLATQAEVEAPSASSSGKAPSRPAACFARQRFHVAQLACSFGGCASPRLRSNASRFRVAHFVFASTSPNLPNSVFTAPSTCQTSLERFRSRACGSPFAGC